jgi:hypothetical protein
MNVILRILLAILAFALVVGLLDYFNLLNHSLNVLIGLIVAILAFLSWDGAYRV